MKKKQKKKRWMKVPEEDEADKECVRGEFQRSKQINVYTNSRKFFEHNVFCKS